MGRLTISLLVGSFVWISRFNPGKKSGNVKEPVSCLIIRKMRNSTHESNAYPGYDHCYQRVYRVFNRGHWKFWRKKGEATLSRGLHIYTRVAYIWWVLAYLAGSFIAMFAVHSIGPKIN